MRHDVVLAIPLGASPCRTPYFGYLLVASLEGAGSERGTEEPLEDPRKDRREGKKVPTVGAKSPDVDWVSSRHGPKP